MKKKKPLIITALVIGLLCISAITVFAVPVNISTTWYENNIEILNTSDIVSNALRYIGWGITGILARFTDACSVLYDYTFGLIDITKYGPINDIISMLRPIMMALMVLSFIAYGLMLYFDPKTNRDIVKNIIIAMCAITCSLSVFNVMNDMVRSFKNGVLSDGTNKQSYELVEANIIDLVNIDKNGNINNLDFSHGRGIINGAGIRNAKTFKDINFNETLNYANKGDGQELYKWSDAFNDKIKYSVLKVNGKYYAKEVPKGILGTTIGNEFYYRYYFDYITAWLEIISYLVIIVCLSYKNVRIVFELVSSEILITGYAADVASGERLRKILIFVRDTYIVLCISILCLKLFSIFCAYLTTTGITGIVKGVLTLFIALAIIDGPNVAEQLLGMDAGLSSSYARAAGLIALGRTIGKDTKKIHGAGKTFRGKAKSLRTTPEEKEKATKKASEKAEIGDSSKKDKAAAKMDEGTRVRYRATRIPDGTNASTGVSASDNAPSGSTSSIDANNTTSSGASNVLDNEINKRTMQSVNPNQKSNPADVMNTKMQERSTRTTEMRSCKNATTENRRTTTRTSIPKMETKIKSNYSPSKATRKLNEVKGNGRKK